MHILRLECFLNYSPNYKEVWRGMAGDIGRRHLLQATAGDTVEEALWCYSLRLSVFLWGLMSLRQEPYRFTNAVWVWCESSLLCRPRLLKCGRSMKGAAERTFSRIGAIASEGWLSSEGAKLCYCDLITPQLLLSCLSQALQRIGLWLKLGVRGSWGGDGVGMTEGWWWWWR